MAENKRALREKYLEKIKQGLTEKAEQALPDFERVESRHYTEFKRELLG